MLSEEQKELLEDLVTETIIPAIFEDLGLDPEEDLTKAVAYLAKLLKKYGK